MMTCDRRIRERVERARGHSLLVRRQRAIIGADTAVAFESEIRAQCGHRRDSRYILGVEAQRKTKQSAKYIARTEL